MEGVEEIPGIVLEEGLDWGWRSFPDYLDRLAARSYASPPPADSYRGLAARRYPEGQSCLSDATRAILIRLSITSAWLRTRFLWQCVPDSYPHAP
jgi:hypothetical protein